MSLLDPHHLISTSGVLGILAIVIAQSGPLIGFLVPADSLLFTAGPRVAGGTLLHLPLPLPCLLVSVAGRLRARAAPAAAGDLTHEPQR
jgi:membrane-associated protein